MVLPDGELIEAVDEWLDPALELTLVTRADVELVLGLMTIPTDPDIGEASNSDNE